jgi:hypothetical protein
MLDFLDTASLNHSMDTHNHNLAAVIQPHIRSNNHK